MKVTSIKVIIFDLTGVIFALNKSRLMRTILSKDLLIYLVQERRNPVDEGLMILNSMRQNVPGQFQDKVAYKGIYLPLCIVQWNQGLISASETFMHISSYFNELTNQSYFKNEVHKKVIFDMLYKLFGSEKSRDAFKPIASTVRLVRKLKRLGNYKLFILSNIDRETIDALQLGYKDIFGYFDGVVTSCYSNLLKPDAAIFNYICTQYELNPTECCFIDDQIENVTAAQNFGMETIHCLKPSLLPVLFKQKVGV